MFGLDDQQDGSYSPATELDLSRFHPFTFEVLVWHLITQVNDVILAVYITFFDPRKDERRRFIPFLFYALVYPIIAINLVKLATLSTWSYYVRTHTCYPSLVKLLLM